MYNPGHIRSTRSPCVGDNQIDERSAETNASTIGCHCGSTDVLRPWSSGIGVVNCNPNEALIVMRDQNCAGRVQQVGCSAAQQDEVLDL